MTTISRPVSTGPETAPVHRTGWLAWLSVVLLIVGLGAGFFVGRVTKADLPSGLATTTTTQLLEDYVKAVNAGDAVKIADLFATDARFTDTTRYDGYTMSGNLDIAQAMVTWQQQGFRVNAGGTTIQQGEFVAHYDSTVGPSMAVYQIKNGKIQNVWIVKP